MLIINPVFDSLIITILHSVAIVYQQPQLLTVHKKSQRWYNNTLTIPLNCSSIDHWLRISTITISLRYQRRQGTQAKRKTWWAQHIKFHCSLSIHLFSISNHIIQYIRYCVWGEVLVFLIFVLALPLFFLHFFFYKCTCIAASEKDSLPFFTIISKNISFLRWFLTNKKKKRENVCYVYENIRIGFMCLHSKEFSFPILYFLVGMYGIHLMQLSCETSFRF